MPDVSGDKIKYTLRVSLLAMLRLAPVLVLLASAMAYAQQQDFGIKRVAVEGGELAYRAGGNPAGEVVLMIHGAGMADSFYRLLAEPALANFHLILVHRRGFGGSTDYEPGTMTREQHTADLQTLLRSLGAKSVHVIAHSRGGFAALALASTEPELVRSVMLLEGSMPFVGTDEERLASVQVRRGAQGVERRRARELRAEGALDDPESMANSFMTALAGEDWKVVLPPVFPGVVQQVINDIGVRQSTDGPSLNAPVNGDFYARIVQPTLQVLSENSNYLDDGYPRATWSRLPHAELRFLPGMGHEMMIVHPAPVAELIADWLADNPIQQP